VSTAVALGQMKAEAAVQPLLATLKDQSWDVRVSAARALGQMRAEAAVQPLLAALEDGDFRVRQSAADVLERFLGAAESTS